MRGPPATRLRPRKGFGQHFLIDAEARAAIADLVQPGPEDVVLEIGPGRGALTAPLLDRLERLVAVEIDRGLAGHLRARFPDPPLRLIEGDVLRLDLAALPCEEGRRNLFVVGNLPYDITAPVLFRLRELAGTVRRAVLTLQKEVAQRLVASPGSRRYGQLTVMLSQCARIDLAREIPPTAFRPVPRVDSAVVDIHFVPDRVAVVDLRRFEQIVKTAFAQRRKMLRNALMTLRWPPPQDGPMGPAALAALAERARIDLTRRAENLTVEDYARLTRAWMEAAP